MNYPDPCGGCAFAFSIFRRLETNNQLLFKEKVALALSQEDGSCGRSITWPAEMGSRMTGFRQTVWVSLCRARTLPWKGGILLSKASQKGSPGLLDGWNQDPPCTHRLREAAQPTGGPDGLGTHLPLPLTSCVALGKWFKPSVP